MTITKINRANGANKKIVSAAIILGVASLASRVVGLLRERVLTTTFGAGDTFDAFVAAFRLPDLVFNLVVVGALSAAFIPLFTEKLVAETDSDSHDDAFKFALSILNSVVLIVIVLCALYAWFAPSLVPFITPGFTGDKLALTVVLSRIMAIQPILLAISFITSGVLNSFKRFVAYALAPILYNVGIIIGVVYLVPMIGVTGLGWGVVLGALLHLVVQVPSVIRLGFRWRPTIRWSPGDRQKLQRMILPRVFGLSSQQVNLFVVTIIGSTLAAGSITVFHLANNVQSLPIGIFGVAFAQAAFPTLAEQIARRQKALFKETLTRTFRYILFFIIPVSIFFFLLRAQLIRVLFGAGAFDWEDTILTFETFGVLLLSLFAQATIPLLVRAFYVQQNTLIPVIISIISMVVNVGLAVVLAPTLGLQGLALAFSLSAIINVFLLLTLLHWRLGDFNDAEVISSLLKITMASVLAGVVLQLLKLPVAQLVNMQRFWGVLVQLLVTFSAGTIVYVALCYLLKCEELMIISRYFPRVANLSAGTSTARFEGMTE